MCYCCVSRSNNCFPRGGAAGVQFIEIYIGLYLTDVEIRKVSMLSYFIV